VDIDAIAEHDDKQQTIQVPQNRYEPKLEAAFTDISFQLLTIFLLAAVKGPKNEAYIQKILEGLDKGAQEEIMKIITKVTYGLP